MTEDRRRAPRPATMIGYLQQLPALAVLQRLAIPILAVGDDGIILYTNPACAAMLGHSDNALAGRPLNQLLRTGPRTPAQSVQALRTAAGTVTAWSHSENGTVKAIVSPPLLIDDPVLVVGLTDVTEWLWSVDRE